MTVLLTNKGTNDGYMALSNKIGIPRNAAETSYKNHMLKKIRINEIHNTTIKKISPKEYHTYELLKIFMQFNTE